MAQGERDVMGTQSHICIAVCCFLYWVDTLATQSYFVTPRFRYTKIQVYSTLQLPGKYRDICAFSSFTQAEEKGYPSPTECILVLMEYWAALSRPLEKAFPHLRRQSLLPFLWTYPHQLATSHSICQAEPPS